MPVLLNVCRWGRVSWRPWLLSLAIDLTSIQLGSAADRVSRVRRLLLLLGGFGCLLAH